MAQSRVERANRHPDLRLQIDRSPKEFFSTPHSQGIHLGPVQTQTGRFPPSGHVCEASGSNTSSGDLAAKLGRGQRGELLLISTAGRSSGKIPTKSRDGCKLHALRQICDQPRKPRMRNGAAPGQPGNLVGRSAAMPARFRRAR